ncbi:MAG: 5'/3'-nucleotidase SurE [Bradymonadaceae bacterium]|nr:5'/3'-nucleotidase SurE [Lujinxingiaceae bacterium]
MTRPIILVTNDDGIHAPGLHALEAAMADLGEVWVVAPQTEQSAVSHAISLRHPLRVEEIGERRIAVSGTPADCVYIALNHVLKKAPALCVSGINNGANLGDDVIYSGTVAGAVEATLCDVPSVAFSLAGYGKLNFECAGRFAAKMAQMVLAQGLARGVFINVNVPKGASAATRVKLAKLGRRNYGRLVIEKLDPRRNPYYWLGGAELGFDDMPGSDCNAIADGLVSVTPVHLDMTHYAFIREMKHWEEFESDTWLEQHERQEQ